MLQGGGQSGRRRGGAGHSSVGRPFQRSRSRRVCWLVSNTSSRRTACSLKASRFVVRGLDRDTDAVEELDLLSGDMIVKKNVVLQNTRFRSVDSQSAYGAVGRKPRRDEGRPSQSGGSLRVKRITQCYRVHFLWAAVRIILGVGCPVRPLERALGEARVLIDTTLDGNRAAVYGALASIFGSLLGFVITAVWIVLGFSASEKLAVVQGEQTLPYTLAGVHCGNSHAGVCYGHLHRRLSSGPRQTDASLGHVLCRLRVHPGRGAGVARCVWVLENIIKLVSQPSKRAS